MRFKEYSAKQCVTNRAMNGTSKGDNQIFNSWYGVCPELV